jgi:hypothetical protein
MVDYLRQRRALLVARERRLRAAGERRDRLAEVDQAVAEVLLAQEHLAGTEAVAASARAELGARLRALLQDVALLEAVTLCGLSAPRIRALTRLAPPTEHPKR